MDTRDLTNGFTSGVAEYLYAARNFPQLSMFRHVLDPDDNTSYDNIRQVLNGTIDASKVMSKEDLFKRIFTYGLENLVIGDNPMEHRYAYKLLKDMTIDKTSLVTVDISGPVFHLLYHAIARQCYVKKLAVEPYQLFGNRALQDIFLCLDLEALEIRCSGRPCIFHTPAEDAYSWNEFKLLLQEELGTLTYLSVSCNCGGNPEDEATKMATMISLIPNLTSARVGTTAETAKLVLEKVDRSGKGDVDISLCLTGDRTEITRTNLVHLDWKTEKVEILRVQPADVLQLVCFDYLKEVHLQIMDQAEIPLTIMEYPRVKTFCIEGSPYAELNEGRVYYEPRPTAIPKTVDIIPMLEDLRLFHVRLEYDEIHSILVFIGERLKRFEVSILDQAECPSERLLLIFDTLTKHNPNLRILKTRDNVCRDDAILLRWGYESYEKYLTLYLQLIFARDALLRAIPLLNPQHICESIARLRPMNNLVDSMRAEAAVFSELEDGQ